MDERDILYETERQELRKAYKEHPELFLRETVIEGPEALGALGIEIPEHDGMPVGYLKLWPQDFIVEEVPKDNARISVIREHTEIPDNPDRLQTLYATLVKTGLSTIEAVEELIRALQLEKANIQFAGIKDKDALTAQRISLRNVKPDLLASLSSKRLFLKDMKYGKGAIERSGLIGNRFHILVRTETPADKATLEKRIAHITKEGFYNFYYLQRFGTPRLINFYWGYLIVRGEYRETVTHYLTEGTPRELPYIRTIRESIKSQLGNWTDVRTIMERLPLMFATELKIVRHLEKNPDDFIGALQQIPEQITLWVYGFSSWLFNNILSSHIKTNTRLPHALPLFLSKESSDWAPYRELMQHMNIWPPPLEHLRPFPAIQVRGNSVATREHASIHSMDVTPSGVALSFTLSKGSYATTFLSHLFRLATGTPPETINTDAIDLLAVLEHTDNTKTLEYFKEMLAPKTKHPFETTDE